MSPRYFLPISLTKYEEAVSEEVLSMKDKLNEDELAERHKDDPRYKQYEAEQRTKVKIVEEEDFKKALNGLFADDKPSDSISDDAMQAFLTSGAIVLKEEEIKKIKAAPVRKVLDL